MRTTILLINISLVPNVVRGFYPRPAFPDFTRIISNHMCTGADSLDLKDLKALAASNTPFSEFELDSTVRSLAASLTEEGREDWDWTAIRNLLEKSAHLCHKDFVRTEKAADEMGAIIGDPEVLQSD